MSQEWSRVVSAKVKEEYMTLKVSKHTAHNSHLKTQRLLRYLSLTLMRDKLVPTYFSILLNPSLIDQVNFVNLLGFQ